MNVAIIDTNNDTREWLARLRDEKAVRIVGRYYSRAKQCGSAPAKRMAFNDETIDGTLKCPIVKSFQGGSEVDQLLAGGFGILSAYQYNSGNPRKLLFGLDERGQAKAGDPRTDHVSRAEEEADLDAAAALAQAKTANQPPGTAIYFGLDFNLQQDDDAVVRADVTYSDSARTKVRSRALKLASQAYFKRLGVKIAGRYKIGLYGCGYASEYLRDSKLHGRPLIEYTWISGSTSYDRTPAVLRGNEWHLFQNKLDLSWFTTTARCSAGLGVDTNVQNPDKADIGAWGRVHRDVNRLGLYKVDAARTGEIFRWRLPAKQTTPIYDRMLTPNGATTCRSRKTVRQSEVKKTRDVRVLEVVQLGTNGVWLGVGIAEDGVLDGYCRQADFAASIKAMPDYY